MTTPKLISAEDYGKFELAEADHRITYGADPSQFGDLYLPNNSGNSGNPDGLLPVVLLIHGGCWRAQYGLGPIGGMARALSQKGVAVWSLEYRRLGNGIGGGGGWPNTFLDAAKGADFLRELANDYPLDLNKVVAVGHSAGGHLALWAAARSNLKADSELYTENPLKLQSVVALAPVCDLERAVAWDICTEASDVLVGGHPREFCENYNQGSPSNLLPLGLKHITINGALDDIVPLEYVTGFVETASKLGDEATLIPVPEVGHFEIVTPSHPSGQLVLDTILAEF